LAFIFEGILTGSVKKDPLTITNFTLYNIQVRFKHLGFGDRIKLDTSYKLSFFFLRNVKKIGGGIYGTSRFEDDLVRTVHTRILLVLKSKLVLGSLSV
jgi:hypothetical protein